MSSLESEPTPEPTVSDPAPTAAEAPAPARPASAWIWVVTLAAGLAAGLGSWLLAEPIHGRYQPPPSSASSMRSQQETAAIDLAKQNAMVLEASLTFGVMGAFLGLTFGMAGGLARGRARRGLAAAAIGLMLGAAGGLVAGWFLTSMNYDLMESIDDDLVVALLVQGGVCAVVGAMAGAAFSLGLGEDGRLFDFRLVAGSLLGALAGLIVYQMVGGIAFPLDETTLPLSNSWTSRLLARGLVAGFAAIGVALAMSANARSR